MINHPISTKTTIAILCITSLGITALLKDVNGMLLAGLATAISGLGGFTIGKAAKPK